MPTGIADQPLTVIRRLTVPPLRYTLWNRTQLGLFFYDFNAEMIFGLELMLPSPFPPARRPQSITVPPSEALPLPSNHLNLLLISPSHARQRRSFIAQHSWRPLHTRARCWLSVCACVCAHAPHASFSSPKGLILPSSVSLPTLTGPKAEASIPPSPSPASPRCRCVSPRKLLDII